MMICFRALVNQCGVVCERSSAGKLVRVIKNQLARKKLDCHNVYANVQQSIVQSFGERTDI